MRAGGFLELRHKGRENERERERRWASDFPKLVNGKAPIANPSALSSETKCVNPQDRVFPFKLRSQH